MRKMFIVKLMIFMLCVLCLSRSNLSADTPQKLKKAELIEYARLLRGKRIQPLRLTTGKEIALKKEDCGEHAFMEFEKALEAASLSKADRDLILSEFDIEGTVSVYETAHFSIQYTTDANDDQVRDHTVDTAEDVTLTCSTTVIGTTVAGNGHPNFVEQVGIWLEYSLDRFLAVGFRNPVPGGKMNVFIENIESFGAATSRGIFILNTLPGYYIQATPAHELFHRIQSRYGRGGPWIREGTARWSVDMVNDGLNRYMGNTKTYLSNMDRDLTIDGIGSYDTVLLWKFFSEQHTNIHAEPIVGNEAIRILFEMVGTYPDDDIKAVDEAVKKLPKGRSIYSTFKNWLVACYVKDLGDPYINPVYDYLEDEQTKCNSSSGFGNVRPVTTFNLTSTSGAFTGSDTVNNWGADYYVIKPDTTVNDIKVSIDNDPAFGNPLYIILAIKDGYASVYQSLSGDYENVFYNPAGSLDQLVVIVAAYEDGGSYDLEVRANEGMPTVEPIDVVLVADCSGSMGTSYGYGYINPTKSYGKLFVDLMQPEDRIGVVSFAKKSGSSTLAEKEYQLTEIPVSPPPDVKTDAKNAIDGLTAEGSTPLGEGLILGHEQITNHGISTHPQAIVLLSDGEENVPPYVSKTRDSSSTILGDINADGIKVFTLILGPSADWAMNILQEIAEETDAHSEYFLQTPLDFAEVFMMLRTAILQDDLLRMDREEVGPENTVSETYEVDTDASTDLLLLAAAWEESGTNLDFEIRSPGQTAWMNKQQILDNPDMKVINKDVYRIVRISTPTPGKWEYRLKFTGASSDSEDYVACAITDRLDINMIVGVEGNKIAGEPLLVTAKLTDKGGPQLGAQLSAAVKIPQRSLSSTITHLWNRLQLYNLPAPGNRDDISRRLRIIDRVRKELGTDEIVKYREVPITLRDDGRSGDLRAGDGVYSGRLTDTTTAGIYTFTINAKSQPGSTVKFQREGITTAPVDIARIDPDKSIVRLSENEKKPDKRKFEILTIGVDKYGNTLWPGFAKDIAMKTDNGQLLGSVSDNEDTSYSRMLELPKGQEANVVVTIRGVELPPVNTVRPNYPWNMYAFGGAAIPGGDFAKNYKTGKNILLGLGYDVSYNFTVCGMVGFNWFGSKTQRTPDTRIVNVSINGRYSFLRGRMAPYIGGGPGLYFADGGNGKLGGNLSFGIDYFITQRLNVEIGSDYHVISDSNKTKFIHVHAGLVFKF